MILNSAPQDQVVMSNVGEVGDFKIKASAKAFSILSSGLYANKVRAIIRELSCNAVDSHTAAGKADVPFEVHLPTTLEPYFYIRDFGTGLNHEQVTSIYTTYFESTKTNSNDYIGALGLGSKSPFSYTDNFTVTAIKDGIKGIYSAFINGDGVPSIVKMGEEQSDEPAGVEIKFSVNDRYDFNKFSEEARNVYRFFKLRPVVTGQTFEFSDVEYETENIIPGVHSVKHSSTSRAVMGNIAYPIEIPSADKTLGDLRGMLGCGLVMEFGIGELDFQASREGLSYIPQTIESIKRKLEALNAQLTIHITEEADKLTNKWDRSVFLYGKKSNPLWSGAVAQYVIDTKFDLYDGGPNGRWSSNFCVKAPVDTLFACNMMIRGFVSQTYNTTMSNLTPDHGYLGNIGSDGKELRQDYWGFDVSKSTKFVVNDTKVGAAERAKHHWRTDTNRKHREEVFVIEPIDRSKPMMIEAFKNLIGNPPTSKFVDVSTLRQKERATSTGMGKNVTIMHLEKRGGSRYRSSSDEMVWRDGGNLNSFDSTKKHYYIPLLGFTAQLTKFKYGSPHEIAQLMTRTGISAFDIKIYGVRKGDIDTVKAQKNWVNLEDHIESTLKNLGDSIFIAGALQRLDKVAIMDYNMETIVKNLDDTSPAKAMLSPFSGLPKHGGYDYVRKLMELLNIKPKVDITQMVGQFNQSLRDFKDRYPLVTKFGSYADEDDVVSYVKLIDEVKGV